MLSRNIGNVNYAYKEVAGFLGSGIGMGRVVHTGWVKDPIFFSVTERRREVDNYLTYAKYINPNTIDKIFAKKYGSIVFDELINKPDDVVNQYNNELNLRFDPYDPLSNESLQYLSMVERANVESQVVGAYESSKDKTFPHQLTSGYTFSTLMEHKDYKGLSVLNGDLIGAKIVGNKWVGDTFLKNTFGVLKKPSFDDMDMPNNIFWHYASKGSEDGSSYSLTDGAFAVQNEIQRHYNDIWARYNFLLSSTDVRKHFKEGVSLGHEIPTEKLTDSIKNTFRYVYAESRVDGHEDNTTTSEPEKGGSTSFENHRMVSLADSKLGDYKDLLDYTNRMFRHGRYKTMIARFGSQAESENLMDQVKDYSEYNTAISERGMSHGRNLLKSKNERNFKHIGGAKYNDPYCRVWTNYHQYNSVHDMIRPFTTVDQSDNAKIVSNQELMTNYGFEKVRTKAIDGFGDGQERLGVYGALNANGFVNITPKQGNDGEDTKKCMFSIENLAWKGCTQSLSKSQIGPLGGRIMWFPPYNLKFSENVSSSWNSSQFIGRGEKIYTYTDTERGGQLSFSILVDHPSIINFFKNNGVDDDMKQNGLEYDLLRFFAGCGHPVPSNISKQDNKNDKSKNGEEEKKSPSSAKIMCMVFFPNNYTGNYEKGGADGVDPITYLMNGVGSQMQLVNGQKVDIPTDDTKVYYSNGSEDSKLLVGYEIVPRTEFTEGGITPNTITDTKEKRENYETGCTYNGFTLVPQTNTRKSPLNDWWYRVDVRGKGNNCAKTKGKNKSVDCELLYGDKSKCKDVSGHKDVRSFGLNSGEGMLNIYNPNIEFSDNVASKDFGLTQDDCENHLYAFSEIYVAFKEAYQGKTPLTEEISNYCATDRLARLREIINEHKGKKKFVSFNSYGYASSHGYVDSNIQLGLDRATTIQKWFAKLGVEFEHEEVTQSGILPTSVESGGQRDESELLAKLGRCAIFTIDISNEETSNLQDSDTEKKDNQYKQQTSRSGSTQNEAVRTNPETSVVEELDGMGGRYDDEYRFFKEIDINDSIFRHRVREKIQYFDPAYHSISPEGFNARLTFLHQCTRQGPTIGNSNVNDSNKIANNLAFGRQPVCVLRVGDFYNTKIVIESLQITYDSEGMKWDLNPEGIGVQPMMADISITFKFLGGSDLAGPIGRLQNAVSFNYYANTGVYDNRAEMIEYDDKGKYKRFKEFNASNNTIKTK